MPPNMNKLALVAQVALPTVSPFPCGAHARMPNQKSVLWQLAWHEGEPLPISVLIELTGLSQTQVTRCIAALKKSGLVTSTDCLNESRCRCSAYHLQYEALRHFRHTPTPPRDSRRRLTVDAVARLRAQARDGQPRASLAAEFGISGKTVDQVLQGRTWKEVQPA